MKLAVNLRAKAHIWRITERIEHEVAASAPMTRRERKRVRMAGMSFICGGFSGGNFKVIQGQIFLQTVLPG